MLKNTCTKETLTIIHPLLFNTHTHKHTYIHTQSQTDIHRIRDTQTLGPQRQSPIVIHTRTDTYTHTDRYT